MQTSRESAMARVSDMETAPGCGSLIMSFSKTLIDSLSMSLSVTSHRLPTSAGLPEGRSQRHNVRTCDERAYQPAIM